ncbi:MAG TPA: hypothetical protein VHT25_01100 [Solirubrobacteraceae bacterium]|jgi:hypothetical protein|nr:hypothetical protein [Solirubrobacteraceae bacterium]
MDASAEQSVAVAAPATAPPAKKDSKGDDSGKVRLFGNQLRWAKQVLAASRAEREEAQR